MWLSLRSMGRACVPLHLEQPPVTFHRPAELTVLLVSRHAAVAALGGQTVRASAPQTAACNIPIALLISHLRSYRATWLSLRLVGRAYVPPRLEQPPVTFQSPC